MKNKKLKIYYILISGLLLLTQICYAQLQGACTLGNSYSGDYPIELHNIGEIRIDGITFNDKVLITSPVGFELDTSTVVEPGCLKPVVGLLTTLPFTFETDIMSDITDINNWYGSPSSKNLEIRIRTLLNTLATDQFIELFGYSPGTNSPGSDGRTSYTLTPTGSGSIDLTDQELGSMFSFNPATDKVVEISNVSHVNFAPAVQVDYTKRVITLEMTYNEGDGLIDWITAVAAGTMGLEESVSIIETTDGVTEISRENFFNVLPFKYETIYGFGLNTRMVVRIQLVYGCNAPG
jgi:hypothetical protein